MERSRLVICPDDKSMWRMGVNGEIFSLQELVEYKLDTHLTLAGSRGGLTGDR